MAATYRGNGVYAVGTTSFVADVPASIAAGDLLVIVMESSDSTTTAGTPNTPTDWTKIFERTEGGGATNVTTLTIFAKIATGSETDVTVDGVGNHCSGTMFAITAGTHGVADVATHIVVGAGDGHGTGTTGLSTTGITVTADSLIVHVAGLSDDANDTTNYSNVVNSNLASITEREDNTTNTGAGGGIAFSTATCAGTTTGATTWDHDTAVQSQSVHIGIPPAKIIAVSQASETETANAISVPKRRLVAQGAETDTSAVLVRLKTATLTIAAETDTAQAVSNLKSIPVSQASESDAATDFGRLKLRSIDQSVETDTAQSIAPSELHAISQAEEVDTAQTVTPVTSGQIIGVGQSSETDSGEQVAPLRAYGVSEASEADTAAILTPLRSIEIAQSLESDTANSVALPGLIERADEIDTAQPITAPRVVALVQAEEVDGANDITPVGEMGTGVVLSPTRVLVGTAHNEVT